MQKIFQTKLVKPGGKIAHFLAKAKNELDAFYGLDLAEPLVFLLDSRKSMDLLRGKKTENWLVGFGRRGMIFIFDPKVFAKVSVHKKEQFWQTLKHELAHLYYIQAGNCDRPTWLNEGMACYLSGKALPKAIDKDRLLRALDHFNGFAVEAYVPSQFWVEKLIKKFGKKKIIALVKSLSPNISEHDFAKLFKKIYKFSYDKKSFAKLI